MAEIIFTPTLGETLTPEGQATIAFQTWMDQVTIAANQSAPVTGSGAPEGAVVASVGKWYVDTAVGAGGGIYFKESGEGDTGWVLRS